MARSRDGKRAAPQTAANAATARTNADERRLAEVEQELLDAKAQILELEESLLSYRRTNAQLQRQAEDLRERLALLEAERGSVLSVAHDRTAELEAEIRRLRAVEPRLAEMEGLRRELLEVRADRDRLAARNAELEQLNQSLAAQVDAARAEAKELDEMCSAIDEARVALETQVRELGERVKELEESAARSAQLESELAELRARHDEAAADRDRAKRERDQLAEQAERARERIAESEAREAALRQRLAELEEALDAERARVRENNEKANKEQADLTGENAALRKELEGTQARLAAREEELQGLRTEHAALVEEIGATLRPPERAPSPSSGPDDLRARLEAAERERDELRRQREQLEHSARELRRRLDEVQAELSATRAAQAAAPEAAAAPPPQEAREPAARRARIVLFDFGRVRQRLAEQLEAAGFLVLSPEGDWGDPRLPLYGAVNLGDPRGWLGARSFRTEGRGRLLGYVLAPNADAAFWIGNIRFTRPEPGHLAASLPRIVAGLSRAAVLSDSAPLAEDLCRRLGAAGVQAEGVTDEAPARELLARLQPEIILVAPSPMCSEELAVLRAFSETERRPPLVFLLPDPAPPVQALALSRSVRNLLRNGDTPPDSLFQRIADAVG